MKCWKNRRKDFLPGAGQNFSISGYSNIQECFRALWITQGLFAVDFTALTKRKLENTGHIRV